MSVDESKPLPWPDTTKRAAAILAAEFQEMMQRPITHRSLSGLIGVFFVISVSVLPLLVTLVINFTVCYAVHGGEEDHVGALSDSYLRAACVDSSVDPTSANDGTAEQDASKSISDYRQETLAALDQINPTSAEEAIARLNAVEQIITAQQGAASAASDKAKKEALGTAQKQYQHYRSVVLFMAFGVAYLAWALMTFGAQTWVVNRLWVVRENMKDKHWSYRDVILAQPLRDTLAFAIVLVIVLYMLDFERYFSLPGALDGNGYPVPWLWILVATLTSATIFITAIGTQRLSHDFPEPARAHILRVKLHQLRRKMTKHANDERDKPKKDDDAHDWPKEVSHIDVLALGCVGMPGLLPPKERPYQYGGIEPRVARTVQPEDNLDAVRTLCAFLIILMVATLIFVSLGFDVLEQKLVETDDLRKAIIDSGNAWMVVLGAGMSVSIFLIYTFAASRLLPYIKTGEPDTKPSNKGWQVKGDTGALLSSSAGVSLEAKPIKAEKPDRIIDRDAAYTLGASEKKLKTIIEGATNSGGFQAAYDQEVFKRITNLIGLIAPAAAGTILTLL